MTSAELLAALHAAGCTVRVKRETLLVNGGQRLEPTLAAAVKAHRDELIDFLLAEEAAAFDAAERVDAGRAVAMFAAFREWNEGVGR